MNGTTIFAALAATVLLLAGGASMAASPAAADEAALGSLQDAYARSVAPGEEASLYRELLATVLQRVKRSSAVHVELTALAADAMKAVEPLPAGVGDPSAVFKKAIHAALQPIDPYSRYFDARTFGNERGELSGSFGGLGLEVESSGGAVRIVAPMPGGPAARAGLAPGDLIVRVDEQPLSGLPLADAIARMRGQPGTPVSITIQRAGAVSELTVSLTRDTIRRQSLRSSMEGEVLVLRLAVFSDTVSASLEQVITQAIAENPPKAVVLDMRGNPGGLLREAVKVADAFLSAGEIVTLRSNSPARSRAWQADTGELLAGLPMVVLIDRRSASASELVADALQHNSRATVMGQRSFGKGSVQTTFPLGEHRGAIKLTTAIYHGPSGQTVHRAGVAPDIELLDSTRAESSRNWPDGTLRPTETEPSRKAHARVDPARCATQAVPDPALSCAVAYLRAGSIEAFVARLAEQ